MEIIYISQDHKSVGPILPWDESFPIFWAIYEGQLLYCEVDYFFKRLEDLELNLFRPGDKELEFIMKHKVRYTKASIDVFNDTEIRNEVSDYEYNIILTWSRDKKINDISDPKKFYHPSNFLKNLSNESTHIELTRHQEYGSPVCYLQYTNVATGQDLEWINVDSKQNKDHFVKVIVDKSTSSQTLQTSKMSKEGKDTNWDDKYFYFTISSIDYTPRKESIENSLKKTQDEFISKVDTINKLINSFEGNTKNWKSILQLEELNSKLNDIKNHLESIKTSK